MLVYEAANDTDNRLELRREQESESGRQECYRLNSLRKTRRRGCRAKYKSMGRSPELINRKQAD